MLRLQQCDMGDTRNQNINISGASGVSIGDIANVRTATRVSAGDEDEIVCRILFLAANPDGTSRLRLDREARAIEDALQAAPQGCRRFELLQGWAASSLDIQQDLFRHRPQLIHYCGHGGVSGDLVLEAQRFRDLARQEGAPAAAGEGGAPPSIAALVRLLAHPASGARCVVLNACHSASLARAVAERVDCAIGMAAAVPDDGAVAFAWGFYHALAQGESVAAAFDLASAQLELTGLSQQQCPRLFAPRCDASSIRWRS